MRKTWGKLFGTATLAFMLCMTGLIITGEAQAERFVDNGNGTVTDTMTGLMWPKDASPFGILSWDDAMARCDSFSTISGIGGWRLPNRDELVTLYHAMKGGHPFTGVQSSYYWSSTSGTDLTDNAWSVRMSNGYVSFNTKSSTRHVWPVRAGM